MLLASISGKTKGFRENGIQTLAVSTWQSLHSFLHRDPYGNSDPLGIQIPFVEVQVTSTVDSR